MSKSSWQETLISITADGTALTAAARASLTQGSALAGRITLRNNFFDQAGKMIKITAQGRISCVVTTPGTARFDVAFNTTANGDSGAMNLNVVAKTNVPWWLEMVGTCRTVGSGTAATIFWFGSFQSEAVVGSALPTAGGNGSLLFTHGGVGATAVGAGFDSTAALPLDLFFTQTVATGSITLQQYKVEELN
jgi:hypothetical protein